MSTQPAPTASVHAQAQDLIAHNPIFLAGGEFRAERHDCGLGRGVECTACECQAFSYMAAWGFDPFFGHLPAGRSIVDRLSKAQER